jgi:type I restriction enzyme M protein
MLTAETKRRLDACRDVLVGKLPLPTDQIELITLALFYKFMDGLDEESKKQPEGSANCGIAGGTNTENRQ